MRDPATRTGELERGPAHRGVVFGLDWPIALPSSVLSMRHALIAGILCFAIGSNSLAQQVSGPAAPRIPDRGIPVARPWPDASSWRHIGPAAFGGRVDDIEAVVGDPRIIFVASASGGVFRSTNAGTTWSAV